MRYEANLKKVECFLFSKSTQTAVKNSKNLLSAVLITYFYHLIDGSRWSQDFCRSEAGFEYKMVLNGMFQLNLLLYYYDGYLIENVQCRIIVGSNLWSEIRRLFTNPNPSDVESIGYFLLTNFKRGVLPEKETLELMAFLVAQRNSNGVFQSIQVSSQF